MQARPQSAGLSRPVQSRPCISFHRVLRFGVGLGVLSALQRFAHGGPYPGKSTPNLTPNLTSNLTLNPQKCLMLKKPW